MRLEAPLSCPRCARELEFLTRCPNCDVAPRDACGREAPVDPRGSRALGDALAVVVPIVTVVGLGALRFVAPAVYLGGMLSTFGTAFALGTARRWGTDEWDVDRADRASRRALRAT